MYTNHTKNLLLAKHIEYHQAHHIYDVNSHRQTLDILLKGLDSPIWWKALTNEAGRLAKRAGMTPENDCIDYIKQSYFFHKKKVTYGTVHKYDLRY